MRELIDHLPLHFRVLYRQFLLRVVDLESLSAQADVAGLLGQFAGVLIMISLLQSFGAFIATWIPLTPEQLLALAWHTEQSSIENMMLVIGLFSVLSWDATFPDRRDAMVLSPLPVRPRTILFAKVAASGALLGLAILALNAASGFAWPLVLAGFPGILQFCPAYWATLIASSVFLYCSVLTMQGLTALMVSRRIFLRASALLQLAAFALFLTVYFLEPSLNTPAAVAAPENQAMLAWLPPFWFFALFNQLNGTLPAQLAWLAERAWIGLGVAVFGAAASLILCYVHTMRKTVEEPDLVPGTRGPHWTRRFGSPIHAALFLFSMRSLTRSRQHRVVFAFYLSVVFAIVLLWLQDELSAATPSSLPVGFLVWTFVMMSVAVAGLRKTISLPISLTANWIWRITQLFPTEKYIAGTRGFLLFFAVLPVWLVSAALSIGFRPLHQAAAHLVVLGLLGCIFAELSLIGFYKVPFTCSYLPGKSNFQFVFWGFLVVLLALAVPCAEYEMSTLDHPIKYICTASALGAVLLGLWRFNRDQAKSAVLYFEELPEELITTLGLTSR
jgi:hypothetical protein